MNRNELTLLLKTAATGQGNANFSAQDAQSAATNALRKYFNVDEMSTRELMRNRLEIFEIIDEVVDEILPIELERRLGEFAEIKRYARDQKPVFKIGTTNASRMRLARGIQRGARGGIYKARRLDGRDFTLQTRTETVAYQITLEDILTGNRTVQEIVQILANAWEDKIFIEVFEALASAASSAPQVNRVVGTTTVEGKYLDKLIGIVRGYGNPMIMAFPQHAGLIPYNEKSAQDLTDAREQGYVGVYKGVPVVILPNYIVEHADKKVSWVFKENKIFVLPANTKPVKVALQGESYAKEVEHAHGGFEVNQHRMMGVGVIFNNNIASYELTDGWDGWEGHARVKI